LLGSTTFRLVLSYLPSKRAGEKIRKAIFSQGVESNGKFEAGINTFQHSAS
jgi:hypothetical protein